MKYRITAIVQSEAFLNDNIEMVYDEYLIKFIKGENNKLNNIQLIKKIKYNSENIQKFKTNYYGIGKHKLLSYKNEIYNETVELLRYIESIGSYWLGIHRILMNNLKIEYIPENAIEKNATSLYEIVEKGGKFERTKYLLDENKIKNILKRKNVLKHLTIPFSFYREGMNEYYNKKYINAFFNFYFFIEGLYSNGKSRNELVVREYLKSEHIKQSLIKIINTSKNNKEYNIDYISIKQYLKKIDYSLILKD